MVSLVGYASSCGGFRELQSPATRKIRHYDLPTSMYSRMFVSKSYMCQGQDISGQCWNSFVENDADTRKHDRPPITSSLSDASKVCASCFADSTELTCQHFISLYLKSVKAVAGHRPWVHV